MMPPAPSPSNPAAIFSQIVSGDNRALARAITLVESARDAERNLGLELVELALSEKPQNTFRVGITGVPGAGKSTLISALGKNLLQRGERVAVLAIDPTSSISRGSVLGDKTRMEGIAAHDNAFIRPSPTRGHLGGVASSTRESVYLCEAAGYKNIFVESVGVGQSEIELSGLVDVFVLLALSGAGDELQGIKRGIMEMADIICVAKNDGENTTAAETARSQIHRATSLLQPRRSGWKRRVIKISAVQSDIGGLVDAIKEFRSLVEHSGELIRTRQDQSVAWYRALTTELLLRRVGMMEEIQVADVELRQKITNGKISPVSASREWLQLVADALASNR